MYNFIPQLACIDLFPVFRFIGINRIFLFIFFVVDHRPHKFVIDLHGYIRSCYFSFSHLCIDKAFRIRMIDRHTQHQSPTPTVLSNFPGRVRIPLHKRNDTGRSQCRIFYRRTLRTDMRQIMSHSTPAFHQLHLFLIDFHNSTV